MSDNNQTPQHDPEGANGAGQQPPFGEHGGEQRGYGHQPPADDQNPGSTGYGAPTYPQQPEQGYGYPPQGYPQQPDQQGYGYPQQGPGPQGYPQDPNQQGYGYPQQQPYGQPAYPPAYYDPEAKSRLVAGLLGILLGSLGVHRFYLGYVGIGIAQILVTFFTFGLGALWGFIEGIMILAKTQAFATDASGRPLRDN